jgi:hypothetical protein
MTAPLVADHAADTVRRVQSVRRGVERAVQTSPWQTPAQRDALAARFREPLLVMSTQAMQAEAIFAQRYAAAEQAPPPSLEPPGIPSPATELAIAGIAGAIAATYFAARRRGEHPDSIRGLAAVVAGSVASRAVMHDARSWNKARYLTDPNIVAYRRVPDNDPCYFCALLASRGFVYKTRESAGDTSVVEGWHNACACTSQELYRGRPVPPLDPMAQRAADVYESAGKGHTGIQKLHAFRGAWESPQRSRT